MNASVNDPKPFDACENAFPKEFANELVEEAEFAGRTYEALNRLGFNAENTITCVGVCRDEIAQSIVSLLRGYWGEVFNISGLAGMFLAGKAALVAAMQHAPDIEAKERYVYYAMAHIAIDYDGRLGACKRQGRGEMSVACGALHSFHDELAGGKIDLSIDSEDVELSLLKIRLMKEIPYGKIPDILELTKITHRVIKTDIENAIVSIIDEKISDHAVITGIQVHAPDRNYIWRASCEAVVSGERRNLFP